MRASEGRAPPSSRLLLLFSCLMLFGSDGTGVAAPQKAVPYREVSLSQRQSLWQLIASLGHPVPGDQFYRFLDRFRLLNPVIKDIGALPVGTPIKLPLLGQPAATRRVTPWRVFKKAVKVKASPEKRERRVVPHLTFAIGDRPTGAERTRAARGSLDPGLANNTLTSIFRALGETYRNEGTLSFPLEGKGSISLDLSRLPVVELSPGERLLFDLGDVLPKDVQALLEAGSRGLTVIKPGEHRDLKGLIAQVFARSGYASVVRESFVTLGDRAKVTIRGDWVILKGEESLLTGQVYIVNLVERPEFLLPSPVKQYAEKHGIVISEFLVGQPSTIGRQSRRDQGAEIGEEALDTSSPERLVDGLLELLGGRYETDVEIPLGGDPKLGFQIRLQVSRVVHRNGERYILDFSGFAPPLVRLIQAQGFKVVRIGPARPEAVIQVVLDLLQVSYEGEAGRFWTTLEPPGSRLQVQVPGFVILPGGSSGSSSRGSPILLTDVPLDPEVKAYLRGKGVRLVRF